MKKFFSIFILSLALCGVARAVVVQHVTLKNGSVLHGFVQQASDGQLTFQSESAIINMPGNNVEAVDQMVPVARLDSMWIRWAEKNDAFEGIGDSRTLTLSNLVFRNPNYIQSYGDSVMVEYLAEDTIVEMQSGVNDKKAAKSEKNLKKHFYYFLSQKGSISEVKVLERGAHIRYLEMKPNTYTFTWDDVSSIKIDRRPKTALSGINCIYQLRNGQTYEGQQAGETRNTLSLYLENGVVQSFDIDDVIKYTFRPTNPNQDIFAQSELLDIVQTRWGAPVKGIIIEQNYSSEKDSENYILVQQESGAIQSVKMSDVTYTLREANPQYTPLTDIVLKVGDVVVNRKEFKFVGVTEKNDVITLDSVLRSNIITPAGNGRNHIVVEYRTADGNNIEAFQLVRVTGTKVKKQNVYSFSYKDLVTAIYRPVSISTSINQTTKAEYVIDGQGIFALYDARKQRAIPIAITVVKK